MAATFATARDLAADLPETEASTHFGKPALKVRKRAFALVMPHKPRPEGETLVLMIDLADKEMLLAHRPDICFETPHYRGYPAVLVRMEEVGPEDLAPLLAAAWRYVAPAALAREAPPAGLARLLRRL